MLFAPWTSTNSQSRLEVYKFVCWANSGRCAWLVLGTSWDCWWGLVPCLAELQLASTRVTHWRLWTTCRQPNIPDIQPKMPNVSKCTNPIQSHVYVPRCFQRDIYPVLRASEPLDSWCFRPCDQRFFLQCLDFWLGSTTGATNMAVPGLFCASAMKIHEVFQNAPRCFKMLQALKVWTALELAELVQHSKPIQVESLPLAFDEFVWMCDVCVWLESCTKLGQSGVTSLEVIRSHSKPQLSCTGRGLGPAIRGPVASFCEFTDFTRISQYDVT